MFISLDSTPLISHFYASVLLPFLEDFTASVAMTPVQHLHQGREGGARNALLSCHVELLCSLGLPCMMWKSALMDTLRHTASASYCTLKGPLQLEMKVALYPSGTSRHTKKCMIATTDKKQKKNKKLRISVQFPQNH